MEINNIVNADGVRLSDDKSSVIIIDQTRLPNHVEYLELNTAKAIYDAIFELKVRGAPAIGICAGYGLYVLAGQIKADSAENFLAELAEQRDYLCKSRPTAVNLSWALNRMYAAAEKNRDKTIIGKFGYSERIRFTTEAVLPAADTLKIDAPASMRFSKSSSSRITVTTTGISMVFATRAITSFDVGAFTTTPIAP